MNLYSGYVLDFLTVADVGFMMELSLRKEVVQSNL